MVRDLDSPIATFAPKPVLLTTMQNNCSLIELLVSRLLSLELKLKAEAGPLEAGRACP